MFLYGRMADFLNVSVTFIWAWGEGSFSLSFFAVRVRGALLWVQNECKGKSLLQTWVMSVMSNEVKETSHKEGGETGELLNRWCAGCQFFTARLLAFNLGDANKLMEEFPVGSLSWKILSVYLESSPGLLVLLQTIHWQCFYICAFFA